MAWCIIHANNNCNYTIAKWSMSYKYASGHISVVEQMPSTWPMLGAIGPSYVNIPNFDENSPLISIQVTPQGLNVVRKSASQLVLP